MLRQRLYRELQSKGTIYRVPADIIISNKTTASLLGYISQSQGNIITHKLVANKKAINIDTPPIKEVKRGISIFDFYESFDSNKYYYCQRTRSVYTRECSHIFLS